MKGERANRDHLLKRSTKPRSGNRLFADASIETVGDLLLRLGGIPANRVRMNPHPGAATERDLIRANAEKVSICELVDGTLVEKAPGASESRIAALLIHYLLAYVLDKNLGVVLGEAGTLRIAPGLVRAPDVSFISNERLPKDGLEGAPFPSAAPDLAVEVLSKSNTKREIKRKLNEYFHAGVKIAWVIDPKKKNVLVYHSSDSFTTLGRDQTLDGEEVLPGFRLDIAKLFVGSK
jgi:Uma2 family endonuclease